ncbi:MAG: DUF4382 domain-containing protein [Candidatus Thiodiazotropha sp.]
MLKRHLRRSALPLILLLLGLLSACGGGSSTTPASAGKTGSVGVVLTDAPADPSTFSSVNASIERVELIGGDGGRVTLFDGPKQTVDLLRLRNEAVPFTFSDQVPVGTYCKVRLTLANPDGLELVMAADGSSYFPKLPGNGKLDLLARDCFTVAPGASVTLQLDMDAGNSLHVVQTGNKTTYNFRPVVFVDVINQSFSGKLVRLEGEIADVDAAEKSVLLCDALPTHQSNGRSCAKIYLGADSAFFDNVDSGGDAKSLDALLMDANRGQSAATVGLVRMLTTAYETPAVPADDLPGSGFCRVWVPGVDSASQPYPDDVDCSDSSVLIPADSVLINDLGAVLVDHRPQIALDGFAVEMGAFLQAYGVTATDASVDGFDMTLGSGAAQAVTLQNPSGYNGTRILSKHGDLLDYSAITVPRALKIDGVRALSDDPINSAVVIVDTDMDSLVSAGGTIGGSVTGGFTLIPDMGTTPCSVSGDLTVLLGSSVTVTTVTITNTTVEVAPGGILDAGQTVSASGQCGADSLTASSIVIVDDQRI